MLLSKAHKFGKGAASLHLTCLALPPHPLYSGQCKLGLASPTNRRKESESVPARYFPGCCHYAWHVIFSRWWRDYTIKPKEEESLSGLKEKYALNTHLSQT